MESTTRDNTIYREVWYETDKTDMADIGRTRVVITKDTLPLTATIVAFNTNYIIKQHTTQYDAEARRDLNIYVLERVGV